ncbi:MAG: hypothetical protein R6U98_09715, partial [Pirellulaceae bacterium]
ILSTAGNDTEGARSFTEPTGEHQPETCWRVLEETQDADAGTTVIEMINGAEMAKMIQLRRDTIDLYNTWPGGRWPCG